MHVASIAALSFVLHAPLRPAVPPRASVVAELRIMGGNNLEITDALKAHVKAKLEGACCGIPATGAHARAVRVRVG